MKNLEELEEWIKTPKFRAIVLTIVLVICTILLFNLEQLAKHLN